VTAVYVYGIAPASERIDVEASGVGGPDAGVRRVVHGDLAALVSDVDVGPLAAARDLRAHWRVLEEAASKATVLPVRFGTILESEDAVLAEFMAPRHDRLAAQLAELSGKVQLSVKCFYDEERLLRDVVQGSSSIARLNQRVRGRPEAATYYERIQLGELVAGEVEQARARDAALVMGRLEPLALAARHEAPSTSDGAVNAAFLVERDRVDEFSAAVTELTAEVRERMRLRYIGPLPPYSFTEEETAAWA
jgi:hypothetical protein